MSYISITDRDDGFGAQFQHILFGIMYSQENGFIYLHKPITKMDHNYNEDPEFIEKIEDFMNIRKNFKTIQEISNYHIIDFWTLYPYVVNNFDKCLDNNKTLLQSIFWKNKKNIFTSFHEKDLQSNQSNPLLNENSGTISNTEKVLNIAVHIRRVNKCDWDTSRIDTNSFFLNIIQKIRDSYSSRKIFHIFSQGDEDNFKEFNQKDVTFHLNEDIKDTFLGLVSADILITSKSALSYCAAILTDGIVYFNEFGDLNPMYSKWIKL
jgi:hypothetical protein